MEINLRAVFLLICGVYYFGHVEGSRSRSSSTRWTRHKYEKQYRVRVYNSHYNEDWLIYGRDGYLYGYDSYLSRSRYVKDNIPPTVCFSDEYQKEPKNGEYDFYESIACPKDNQTDDMNMCCGSRSENEQYCCTSEDKKRNNIITLLGGVIGVIVLISSAACWLWKMKGGAYIASWCSKRKGNSQQTPATGQESHPLNTVPDSSVQYPRQKMPDSSVQYPRQTMPDASAQYPYQGIPTQENASPNMAPYYAAPTPAPYYSPQPGAAIGNYQQNNYVA